MSTEKVILYSSTEMNCQYDSLFLLYVMRDVLGLACCPRTSRVLGARGPKIERVLGQLHSPRTKYVLGIERPRTEYVLGIQRPRTDCQEQHSKQLSTPALSRKMAQHSL